MNRRHLITIATLALSEAALVPSLWAAHDGKIGVVERAEWTKANREAGDKVKTLKPGTDTLSEPDKKLLIEIAKGGITQLELSKIAAAQAVSKDVKAYAQSEVDEQTILAAKLKQIASARGVTLPNAPDESARKIVDGLNKKSGSDLDAGYLQEAGVAGHESLAKIMTKVQSEATDGTLKDLATITLPLIQLHLQAAKDEMNDKD